MNVGPLHPPTLDLDPGAATEEAQANAQSGTIDGKAAIDPEKLRLAKEFEQIFLRKMLSSLEKSGSQKAGASPSAGGSAYGSMVVAALAQAVSKGGGIGLAEVIARAASQAIGGAPASGAVSTAAIDAAIASATDSASATTVTPRAAHLTAPENVRSTVSQPPSAATYARPAPSPIIDENNDIHESFKDPDW